MKRHIISFIAVLIFLSCGGEKQEIKENADYRPQRIVSLVPALTDAVIFHNAGDSLVGASKYCVPIKENWDKVEDVGTALTPDIEKILQLKPDLILTQVWQDQTVKETLERVSRRVIFLPDAKSMEEVAQNMLTVGIILGETESAKMRVEKWKDEVRGLLDMPSGSPGKRIRAYIEVHSPGRWTFGKNSYLNTIMEGIGIDNIYKDEEFEYKDVTDESIVERAPELIILFYAPYYEISKDSVIRNTPAGKNKRIIIFERFDEITIPGPGLINSIKSLKEKLEEIR